MADQPALETGAKALEVFISYALDDVARAEVLHARVTPRWQHSPWTKFETCASDAVIPVLAEGKPEAVIPPPSRRWNAHESLADEVNIESTSS